MKIKFGFMAMLIGLLSLLVLTPAYATHTPAPEFDRPGKIEQCEFTDPSDTPVAGEIPPYDSLLEMRESDCYITDS